MRDSGSTRAADAILGEDEGRIVEELRDLKSQRSPRQARIAKALRAVEQTYSARVRNAAALALADLRAAGAKDVLINLLQRPETKGSRGTLLYALEQLRSDIPVPVLANIVVEDPYEAREEAVSAIARGHAEGAPEDLASARAKLKHAVASADPERLHAIRRALDYLTTAAENSAR
jgi:hypothetical protein